MLQLRNFSVAPAIVTARIQSRRNSKRGACATAYIKSPPFSKESISACVASQLRCLSICSERDRNAIEPVDDEVYESTPPSHLAQRSRISERMILMPNSWSFRAARYTLRCTLEWTEPGATSHTSQLSAANALPDSLRVTATLPKGQSGPR